VDSEQAAAFRLARHGLVDRAPLTAAQAVACPASDFQRGSALLAIAARTEDVTREGYERLVDAGELWLGPTLRGAIHAQDPVDAARYGPALVAAEDDELAEQLGAGARHHLAAAGVPAGEALAEVTRATRAALARGRALTKDELHAELRDRVRGDLLPWCRGCGSHHVAPMLWRYAAVQAGVRLDAGRRMRLGRRDRRRSPPPAAEAARRFLRFHGPATAGELADWAGLARAHARRVWQTLQDDLAEVTVAGRRAFVLREDVADLASLRTARGVRLLPPRDPYLQHPDRAAIAPDAAVRKRLFRAVGGPGAVLQDGRLAGLWRVRAKGARAQLEVEPLGRLRREAVEAEAARIAPLRGAQTAEVRWT
jgi:hypothetical protein